MTISPSRLSTVGTCSWLGSVVRKLTPAQLAKMAREERERQARREEHERILEYIRRADAGEIDWLAAGNGRRP
jgi:hypothetical protein